MSFYIFLYLLVSIFILISGVKVYNKNKNRGAHFLISTIFISIRLLLYIFSFITLFDKDVIMYLSRLMFISSLIGMYSMLFYYYYFNKNTNNLLPISLTYLLLGVIVLFTDGVVLDMTLDVNKGIYYDVYGYLYNFFLALYYTFMISFLYVGYKSIKKQSFINKIRLKYIFFGFIGFIYFSQIFELLLPYFNIDILEREIIFFTIPFIFGIWYSLNRYHFTDLNLGFGRVLSFVLSYVVSYYIVYAIKLSYIGFGDNFNLFWGNTLSNSFFDTILILGVFIVVYNIVYQKLFGLSDYNKLIETLNGFKENIPFINNLNGLNIFLSKKVKKLYNINLCEIKVVTDKQSEVYKYFSENLYSDIIVNNIVFFEENKNKFDDKKLKEEIGEGVGIVFPMINNKGEVIGILEIGEKPFKENYYSEEIEIIKNFVNYLTGHLKYIDIYGKINDLNINLDRKIDEKTIQFNELINRQKEFIGIISHEIKTPLAASIFQVDSLLDDISDGENDVKFIKEELLNIETQLFKISKLTNSLFVNQRYDLGKIELFKEEVDIEEFITLEIKTFEKKFNKIKFDTEIETDIGEVSIDKVQFSQVISNLIYNATKFADKKNGIISIKVFTNKNLIEINIEDNGKGFGDTDTKSIFEKYNTGNKSSVGIGMGLYLCDKIVRLHGGVIDVSNSKELRGARFAIKLNKN